MTGADVREVYEAALPDEALEALIKSTGFQQRERRLLAKEFIRAAVIAAATGNGGRQADLLRTYFEGGAPKVVRGASYGWFGRPFEAMMEGVRERTFAYARSQVVDLPAVFGRHVRDWHVVDSTTVKLDSRLKSEYPGTGDYAALKLHKRFSIGLGTLWDYHISPAREHDAPHLHIDESWRGLGLLVDLGYASHQLLRDCGTHGVHYVIRLKEGWKPKVDKVHRGELLEALTPGADFDTILAAGVLRLAGRSIDLGVTLASAGDNVLTSRLVGVSGPKGWCWYLTSLPTAVKPTQVLDLYRVRWEIEADNKLDKSCLRLDEVKAHTGAAVRGLIHAAMVSAMLVCLIAHRHRLREAAPPKQGTERTKPPIHPQMMARQIGVTSNRIAAALALSGQAAEKEWEFIAALLLHQGTDPNWRSRPSVLDQMRGWRITPGKPRGARAAYVRARRAN